MRPSNPGRPAAAWQVCWEVDEKNEKRKIAGLLEAMGALKIESCAIITGNREGSIKTDGFEVKLVQIIR
jgi:hypothetical protein